MFYLMLAILCSSSIALVFKVTESKDLHRQAVTTFNYLTAITIAALFLFAGKTRLALTGANLEDLVTTVMQGGHLTGANSQLYALLLGMVTGIFFYGSFMLYQYNVRHYGASLTGMFSKLGILVPMLVSVILWKEYPTSLQWLAISLSLVAIVLVNAGSRQSDFDIKATLLFLFIVGGMAEFLNKIFQQYAAMSDKPLFLVAVFGTALLISGSRLAAKSDTFDPRTLGYGIIVGTFNLFSSHFLIQSLETVKTSVAFALFSSMSMSLILVASGLFFKERLASRERIAVGLTIVALFLLNR